MPSEQCLYNEHDRCRGCECDCHQPRRAQASEQVAATQPMTADPAVLLTCPRCLVKRPGHERFCRVCGVKLASLACPGCNTICEPSDSFCWQCGCPLSKDAAARVQPAAAELVAPMPSRMPRIAVSEQDAAQAEQEVLRSLQRSQPAPSANGEQAAEERTWTLPQGTFRTTTRKPASAGTVRQAGARQPFNPRGDR